MQRMILWGLWGMLLLVVVGATLFMLKPHSDIVLNKGDIREITIENYDEVGQHIFIDDKEHVVILEGWDEGKYFRTQTDNMKITTQLNPKDGIMDGFISHVVDDDVYFYVYLDEDFKKKLPETRLYWGMMYENEKYFDFSKEIDDGVYLNIVRDNPDRFGDVRLGGIYVGDINTSTLIGLR